MQLTVKLLKNEQYKTMGVPHIILNEWSIVMKQLWVRKGSFRDTQEIVFRDLGPAVRNSLLQEEDDTHIIEFISV